MDAVRFLDGRGGLGKHARVSHAPLLCHQPAFPQSIESVPSESYGPISISPGGEAVALLRNAHYHPHRRASSLNPDPKLLPVHVMYLHRIPMSAG